MRRFSVLGRRQFLSVAGAMAGLSSLTSLSLANDYPARPIRVFVGYPPGGPTDIIARLIAQRLTERLNTDFVVENRPGADGNIATEVCAHGSADGYTLLMISGANAYNMVLYEHLNFDFIRDIAPVASIGRVWAVMEVHPAVPAKTAPEFITYAKAHPGEINMASAGIGSGPHLYGELFKQMAGVDLRTVQYPGSGPALLDLVSGRVQVMFDLVVSSIGYIRAGKLRPLGVTSIDPLRILPEVPPIADFVHGYKTEGWYGLGAPAGTPTEVVNKLNQEINAALIDPQFSARLAEIGVAPFASSPTEFRQFIIEFASEWGKIIRTAGIKLD
jgi:tripartite-type tricarboxylate transporter receptor subunit TctC